MSSELTGQSVNAFLSHYGVKGMKWGVRRYQNKDGSLTQLGRKRSKNKDHSDFTKARELKNKGYKSLSTKELQELTQRLSLERNLRDLKSSDYQKGLQWVKTITAAGTTLASLYALSTTPLGMQIKKTLAG